MICRNCGNEIGDGAVFCPHCGASIGGETPVYPSPEAPVGGGKKKTGLLIGGVVAVVAVVSLIAAAAGLFANPKGQVEKALTKSGAAYAAGEQMGIPDLEKLSEERSVSQRMSLELNSLNSDLVGYDLDNLRGLGLRMTTDLDGKGRKMAVDLGAYWEQDDLLSFQMLVDDDKMYFSSPQFTEGIAYGVNTETLGKDLTEMTGDDSMDSVSFNLFDLIDMAMEQTDPEAMEQAMKQANKDLWEAVEVKKEGAKTLDVNGASTKTTAYLVTVPQDALYQYIDELETVLSAINVYGLYEEIYRSMGMPQEEIDEFMSYLEEADVYGELADDLRELVDRLGDVELEVCLDGGYVAAVLYEDRIDGSDVSVSLYLGGGDRYVDDLSLEIEVEGNKVTITSTGDHGGKDGAFTDKTTIKLKGGALGRGQLTSEFSYDPKASGNNLTWSLSIPGAGSLDMEGRMETGKDTLSLKLSDIALKITGLEVCSLGMTYEVGPCRGVDLLVAAPKLLTEMDMEELSALAYELQDNAEVWVEEIGALFAARLPAELLYGLAGVA